MQSGWVTQNVVVFCQGQTKVRVWLGSNAGFWEALRLFILVTVFITLTFSKKAAFSENCSLTSKYVTAVEYLQRIWSGANVSWHLISGVCHLHFSFLPLQLWAERSCQQIQGTDIWRDSRSGQFSIVAGSYSSLSSKTLMLQVSHFTSSGQQAKLTVLGYVPSLLLVYVYVLLNSLL